MGQSKSETETKFPTFIGQDGKTRIRVRGRGYDSPLADQSRAMNRLFYGAGQFPSTIQEAYLKSRYRKELLLKDLQEVFEKYQISSHSPAFADQFLIQVGHQEILGSDLRRTMAQLEVSIAEAPVTIHLEEDHQPSLTENLGSVVIPSVLGTCVVKLGMVLCDAGKVASHASTISNSEAMDALSAGVAVGAGLALATLGERVLGKWDIPGLFLKYTRDLFLVNGRDLTMARRLHRAFNEDIELDAVLVIVGSNHVGGLSKNLISEFGFKSRSLP